MAGSPSTGIRQSSTIFRYRTIRPCSSCARASAVTVFTTKPDKYDRYLADVFLTTDDGELFLNGALLENGHAVRKEAWEFGDWDDPLGRQTRAQ